MSPIKLSTDPERPSDPERDAMIAEMERDKEERQRAAEGIQRAREEQQQEIQAVAQAMANAILAFYQGKAGGQAPQVDGYVLLHASLNLIATHAMYLEREAQCQILGTAIAILASPLHSPPPSMGPPPSDANGQEPQVEVVSEPH